MLRCGGIFLLYALKDKFLNHLQFKMTAILLTVVIFAVAVMATVSGYFIKQHLEREIYDKQRLLSDSFTLQIKEYITQHKNVVESVAKLETFKNMSDSQLVEEKYLGVPENAGREKRDGLRALLKIYPEFSYMACYTDKVKLILGEPYATQIKANPQEFKNGYANREWYKGIEATKKTYLSEVTFIAATGRQSVAIATSVANAAGTVTGYWMAALDLKKINEMTQKLSFGTTGHAYLIDKNGAVIAHPDDSMFKGQKELINIKDTPIAKRVLNKESGKGIFLDPLRNKEVLACYSPIEGTDWNIIIEQDKSEAFAAIDQINLLLMLLGLILVVLFGFIVYLVTKRVTQPIVSLTKVVTQAADGNLTVQSVLSSKDEIGQLGMAANVMINNLRDLVQGVQMSTHHVSASSEELTANSGQAAQASSQVAGAVTEVAKGTEKQFKAVIETAAVADQIAGKLQNTAAAVAAVAEKSDGAAQSAQAGAQSAQSAMEQMLKIEQSVNASAVVVAKLGARSKEIGQIVDTIAGIAGQTNLLALNAAIEAARAGEQGRGFAVVAEEVRKLAEQSGEAAKQIAHLIREIQNETDQAVDSMTEGSEQVKVGTEVVNDAGSVFQTIASVSMETNEMMKNVLLEVQHAVGGSQQIANSMQEIDLLSKDIASQTQTVAAATEEQSASMEEIASASHSLAQMAQELQNAVKKFQV
jgi:methyl-accepting chemotaxis protein